MKKKILALLFSFIMLFSLFSCGEKTVKRYDYDLSQYVDVGQIDPIRCKFVSPDVITEEDVDHAVFQIMLGYSAFEEKEGPAEQYDRVKAEYQILYEGEPIDEYSSSEYYILIGYESGGDIDWLLGQALIGKNKGETASITYTFPESDVSLGVWAGRTVEATAKVLAVYDSHPPECTDEFVQNIGSFSFSTVLDFRQQLREDILDQREADKKEAVKNAFLNGVTVKKYPEAELQAYVTRFLEEIKASAEEMDMTLSEYAKEYFDMTESELSRAAMEDAKERVKNDLACIQASRLLKTTLTDEEYEAGLQRYFESEGKGFETVEDFEKYYTRDFMYESILWDKTFETLVEKAENIA